MKGNVIVTSKEPDGKIYFLVQINAFDTNAIVIRGSLDKNGNVWIRETALSISEPQRDYFNAVKIVQDCIPQIAEMVKERFDVS